MRTPKACGRRDGRRGWRRNRLHRIRVQRIPRLWKHVQVSVIGQRLGQWDTVVTAGQRREYVSVLGDVEPDGKQRREFVSGNVLEAVRAVNTLRSNQVRVALNQRAAGRNGNGCGNGTSQHCMCDVNLGRTSKKSCQKPSDDQRHPPVTKHTHRYITSNF